MKSIDHIFLKCYYGYRNLGDEMLLLGVIPYVFSTYKCKKITIQSADPAFLYQWLQKNNDILSDYIDKISVVHKYASYKRGVCYVFWWGEVFSERRGFYGGWNYLFRYFWSICTKNFMLFGGLQSPTIWRQKLLYAIILPRAKSIVMRDETSYEVALQYNKNAVFYKDFAVPVVEKLYQNSSSQAVNSSSHTYIVLNLHPSIASESNQEKLVQFAKKHKSATPYYVPCATEDKKIYTTLQKKIPGLLLYDWTKYSAREIVSFFAQAKAWIGARLHFLLLLQHTNVPLAPLIYAQKIKKLIDEARDDYQSE